MSHTYCIVLWLFSSPCIQNYSLLHVYPLSLCCAVHISLGTHPSFRGASHVFGKAHFLLPSASEIASDLGPGFLGRISKSSSVLFPRDSSHVTRRAPVCEWVWRADLVFLISSAPGRFLIQSMPWSYFWLVCKLLLIRGQGLSSWPNRGPC